jgi:23S rRNA (uracil1939-C5)-methyltransferase
VGRKRSNTVLEQVRITDIGSEGNAIGRVNEMVVFVPMLIPGDVADIRVLRKRKSYIEGKAVKIHEFSPDRIEPACSHFGICGGCRWQHLPYPLQLFYKEKQVRDNLTRIGKISLPEIRPIIGSDDKYRYRNKLEYTFSSRQWLTEDQVKTGNGNKFENVLGFHIPGAFDKVLRIDECHLQPEPTNLIRNSTHNYAKSRELSYFNFRDHTGLLRNIIIRNNRAGEFMVIVVFNYDERPVREEMLEFVGSLHPQIKSLMYVINSKKNDSLSDQEVILYKGADHLMETMDGLSFRIGPKSFYQTNTLQALKLYNTVREFAGLKGNETVYDLYTGTGTIACYLARSAKRVVGMEYVSEAVTDAIENSRINNIENTSFHSGDIKDLLNEEFIRNNGKPDVIVTDPPRAGMHESVVKAMISASPDKIVYVSCNPATQARDISLMSEFYEVTAVQPVDMFPHTHHVENVVLMIRK